APAPAAKKDPSGGTSTAVDRANPDKEVFEVAIVLQLLPKSSVKDGEIVFKVCSACHTAERNGEHKLGPNLWDILGRPKAALPDFKYSQSLQASGGIWSYRALADYNNDPRKSVPGTSMFFVGISENQRMADLLAYLRSLSDAPRPLPR